MSNVEIEHCTTCGKPAHPNETDDHGGNCEACRSGMCADCGALTRGACLCDVTPEVEECEECGGDGTIEVYGNDADDVHDEACPKCDGAGGVTDDGPDFDPDDRPLPTEDTAGLKESPL